MGATGRELHINNHLSNVALTYSQADRFIAQFVSPIVRVPKRSNLYPIWSQADQWRVEDDTRAENTEANKIVRNVTSDSYFAKKKSLGSFITLEDIENMDAAFVNELRTGAVSFVTEKLMLSWEDRLASQVRSTTNVGSSSTVASAWTDYDAGDSDPLNDIWTGMANVEDATGYVPNNSVMGRPGWRNFQRHADVIDIIHGDDGNVSASRLVTKPQAANIFELDKFLVGGAFKNTNEQGQSASLESVWNDDMLLYYAPAAPSLMVPSFMYAFRWVTGGIPDMRTQVHPMDTKKDSQDIDVTYYQDEKITSSVLAFLIKGVNSSQ
jgi:hypothetical protein